MTADDRRSDLPPRMLRNREVTARTGLSRTTLWRLERDGDFPPRRQLSPNAVGWPESEVRAWIEGRQMVRHGGDEGTVAEGTERGESQRQGIGSGTRS